MSLKISNAACPLGENYKGLLQLEKSNFDRIVTKTCTLKPIELLKYPFYESTETYSLNHFGLGNPGYKKFASYRFDNKHYTVSVAGNFSELKKLVKLPTFAHRLEFNISCPNFDGESIDIQQLAELEHSLPFGVKLPPYLELEEIEKVAEELRMLLSKRKLFTYIVCCNTISFQGKGLGGPILKPISLYNIEYFKKLIKGIEIWGCGGIRQVDDMIEYEMAGADGIQMGTIGIDKGLEYTDSLITMYREIKEF